LTDVGGTPPRHCEYARSSIFDVVDGVTRNAFFSCNPVDLGFRNFGVEAIGEFTRGLDSEASAVIDRILRIIIHQHKLIFSLKVEVANGVDGGESLAHHDIFLAFGHEISKKAAATRTLGQHGVNVVSKRVLFTEPMTHVVGAHAQQLSRLGIFEVFWGNTPVVAVGPNPDRVFRSPANIVRNVSRSEAKHGVGPRALGEFPKSHRAGTTTLFSTVVEETRITHACLDLNVIRVFIAAKALGLSHETHVPEAACLALEEAVSWLPEIDLVWRLPSVEVGLRGDVAETTNVVVVFTLIALQVVRQRVPGVNAVRLSVSIPLLDIPLLLVVALGELADLHAVLFAIVVTAKGVGVALILSRVALVTNWSSVAKVLVIITTITTEFALGVTPTAIFALFATQVAFAFPPFVCDVVAFATRAPAVIFVFVQLHNLVFNKGF